LAIIFELKKFYRFVFNHYFILVTDDTYNLIKNAEEESLLSVDTLSSHSLLSERVTIIYMNKDSDIEENLMSQIKISER
jgi:Cdc6-like AAA superfamily ATPase